MRGLSLVFLPTALGFLNKPVEQMKFSELLIEGMHAINNITHLGNMAHDPDVIRMQQVLAALAKTIPLVAYDESITPLERRADGFLHQVFHPVDTARDKLHGLSWDVRHITQEHSAFIILRGLAIAFCLYILVGAIIMAKYYNANGVERIPHLSFWLAYPGLVVDGITFVADRLGFDTSSTGYQRLSVAVNGKTLGARDTFSQFEPI